MKDAETNLGLTAVVPKDCSPCVHRVQFNILACRSFSYSVPLEAAPPALSQKVVKLIFGGRQGGGCLALIFKEQVERCLKGRVRGEDGMDCLYRH